MSVAVEMKDYARCQYNIAISEHANVVRKSAWPRARPRRSTVTTFACTLAIILTNRELDWVIEFIPLCSTTYFYNPVVNL